MATGGYNVNAHSASEHIANKRFFKQMAKTFEDLGYTPDAQLQALLDQRSQEAGSKAAALMPNRPDGTPIIVKDKDGLLDVVIKTGDTLDVIEDEPVDGDGLTDQPAPAPNPPSPAPAAP